MAALYRRERIRLVAALLEDRLICPVAGCTNEADSPHEPQLRSRGGSITDPANVVRVCWEHNQTPPADLVVSKAQMRHQFIGDEIGYLCDVCKQPTGGWRHR